MSIRPRWKLSASAFFLLATGAALALLQGAGPAAPGRTGRGTTTSAPRLGPPPATTTLPQTRSGSLSAPASRAATATSPSTATSAASSPATTAASAPVRAVQADALLKAFPANANIIAGRTDARNFTLEGRVRDVRTLTIDPSGIATMPGTAAAVKTEIRVYLVGRGQPDEVAAHFTCRMEKASEDAARQLQPDQLVRLTGAIGPVVAAGDRIELQNCHDLTVLGSLNISDQVVGNWHSTELMVDGAALKKSNQARGIKSDDVPESNYLSPWHLDLVLKADNTLLAELADNKNQPLKKITGRYLVLKDGPDEARLRIDIPGSTSQETSVSIKEGRLTLTLPGLADRFILPGTHFAKQQGTPLAVDNRALHDQTMQWFAANIVRSAPDNVAPFVANAVDGPLADHAGFFLNAGSAAVRSGKTTLLLGAYGRLTVLEYNAAQTQLNAGSRQNVSNGIIGQWGTLMVPEVKIDSLIVNNRNTYDPGKPLTGKLTLRGLRRMPEGQYMLLIETDGGMDVRPLEKPGPDPQTLDFQTAPLPQGANAGNPRWAIFLVARQGGPADVFGDATPAGRVISPPTPILLDVTPPK